MSKEMILEKQKQAVEILNEKNIDMWMTFVRESSNIPDPMMETLRTGESGVSGSRFRSYVPAANLIV